MMSIMTSKRVALILPITLVIFGVSESRATEPRTFMVAAASGYGLEDCLSEGGECGRVVADAWCEAHGRGAALKFGLSNEVSPGLQPYFITCGD